MNNPLVPPICVCKGICVLGTEMTQILIEIKKVERYIEKNLAYYSRDNEISEIT